MTYYRWRQEYGGLKTEQVERLGRTRPGAFDRLELANPAQLAGNEAAWRDGAGVLVKVPAVGSKVLLADIPAEPQPAVLGTETQQVAQRGFALVRDQPAEGR